MMKKSNKQLTCLLALVMVLLLVFSGCAGGKPAAPKSSGGEYLQGVVQNTQYGLIEGFEESGSLNWFGIPYAKAPVGELRWKAPQRPDPWTGTLNAAERLVASQMSAGKLIGTEEGAMSLDITRPDTGEENLPVLFFIHGGNNQTGRSSEIPATEFVKEINAVVVSINHRLGLQGFNALPALKTGTPEENSGNFTLLDIAASLDWVAENIGAFGGNGNNITVMGLSAGGRDLMTMLISPFFEGKFQKAIVLSGGMTTADVSASQKVTARALAGLAVKKGAAASSAEAEKWLLGTGQDVRNFLYGLSDEELASAFGGAAIRLSAFPHLFEDGVIIPKESFDTNKYISVPLMMLTGASEFSLFSKSDPMFSASAPEKIMADQTLLKPYIFAETYGSLMWNYFNTEESAKRMFNKYDSPIYTGQIMWGENAEIVGEEMAVIYGSYHSNVMPLMTHVLNTGLSMRYADAFTAPAGKAIAEAINQYYKNFIWTGNPNGKGLPKWDAWTSLTGTTQLLIDADKNGNIFGEMSREHTTYEAIFAQIEADTSISREQKNKIIREVLNGRWFSADFDRHFGNADLW